MKTEDELHGEQHQWCPLSELCFHFAVGRLLVKALGVDRAIRVSETCVHNQDTVPWRLRIGEVSLLVGRGHVLETTQDSWTLLLRLFGTAQLRTHCGLFLLALRVPTCRGCYSELFSVRDTRPLPTRPHSDERSTCGSPRKWSRKSASVD